MNRGDELEKTGDEEGGTRECAGAKKGANGKRQCDRKKEMT